jgi:hypothetical protein
MDPAVVVPVVIDPARLLLLQRKQITPSRSVAGVLVLVMPHQRTVEIRFFQQ